MKHIGTKLFFGFLCMALLTVAVLWIVQAGIMRDDYINQRVSVIHEAVETASGQEALDYTGLEETLSVSLLHTGTNGEVLYMSQRMPMRGMVASTCKSVDWESLGNSLYIFDTQLGDARYAATQYTLPSEGTLYIVFPLTNIEEAAAILRRQLWIITLSLLALAVALAVVLSRHFSRPIRNITGAARSMAQGDLAVRLPLRSKDEIGQLTQALNDLGEQLRINENLRRELIANVSHELRTPLSVIRGYAETVRDVTWPHTDKREEQLTLIADEASRLSQIVTDILDYSRMQSGAARIQIEPFGACDALNQAAKRHENAAVKKHIHIDVVCENSTAYFDQRLFERVLDNLLSNAVAYADEHTTVAVLAKKSGHALRIEVKNKGSVIQKDELGKIFERYYRGENVKQEHPGTGLGLAIVKSIFDLHNTNYGVLSDNGETIFYFNTLDMQ